MSKFNEGLKTKKTFEWQNLPLLKLSQTAMQELRSHIVITEKREKAISQTCIKLRRAFTDKVINLTDEPVVQCNVPVIKKYFCRLR